MDTQSIVERTGRHGAASVLIGLAFAVAACSSSGTAPTAQPGGGSTPGAAATTPATQPTQAAAATTSGGGGGGGGGSAGNVCDLVTPAEMSTAIKVDGLHSSFVAGPPDTCGYDDSNDGVAAIVLTPQGGDAAYSAIAALSDSQSISGLGDKAFYNATGEALLVMKGGKLLTFTVSRIDADLPGPRVDVLKQIATIAVGRL